MAEWLHYIIETLPDGSTYLLLVALVAYIESIPLIGLAMPGSTLIVLAGFLAAHGKSDLGSLFLYSTAGAFLGDFTSYWLGGRLADRYPKREALAWLLLLE